MFDPQIYSWLIFKHLSKSNSRSYAFNKIWMSVWEEHCTECAVPLCYSQCTVYKKRNDGKCSRIQRGIVRNFNYQGLLKYGLECSFNKWGKIESRYYPFSCNRRTYRALTAINYYLYPLLLFLDKWWLFKNRHSLLKKYRQFRNKYFISHYTNLFPDAFFIECILINKSSVCINIQFDDNISNTVFYSQIHTIQKGINQITIPFDKIRFDYSISPNDYAARLRIFVAPINEESITSIVFTYLNFISRNNEHIDIARTNHVKCVAWDLDNTLWDGIFSEIGCNVSLKEESLNTIIDFDGKGIINTIISKNNYDETITFLEKLGLLKYFVLPAINWGSKSENIKKISLNLNISLDAFAFIDDDPHELQEVKMNCPSVRIYSVQDINKIIKLPDFNPPVSEFSTKRRELYQAEIKRSQIYLSSFPDDYQGYLRQLGIQLTIMPIDTSTIHDRCFELISRSNQYNLRPVRYTYQEFNHLLANSQIECYAVSAKDKYGNYGIICFFSIMFKDDNCKVLDLVFSCRIARKKIEAEIVKSIQLYSCKKGCKTLQLTLVKTPKNKPLISILDSLLFEQVESDMQIEYSIKNSQIIITEEIANVFFKELTHK